MIVVTGANGHLGLRLLRALSGRNQLRAIVRSEHAAARIAALDLDPVPDVRLVDYLDAKAMADAFMGASHVVHLVGILKQTADNTYADAHENASAVLSSAASQAGIERIVYLSILGSHHESANACLASKGAAERMLMEAETPVLVLRVPMVLGEGDYASAALGRRARRGWNVLLRGSSYEQPIYADDVIRAIIAGLSAAGLDNATIDLAGPTALTRAELTHRAAAILGRRTRIVSLPLAFGLALVFLLERLSANPPVTRTMLRVLDHDDQIDPEPGRRRLGIELTDLDLTLARCINKATM